MNKIERLCIEKRDNQYHLEVSFTDGTEIDSMINQEEVVYITPNRAFLLTIPDKPVSQTDVDKMMKVVEELQKEKLKR